MHPMLNIAVRAARAAGKILVKNFEQGQDLKATQKSPNDWVTELDKAAEDIIIATIKKSYPKHGFVAEESGVHSGEENDYQWVIDPLDGTTNYLRGIPHFCISIALMHKGATQQAVVYDPLREELFTASRGAGAQLNGRRLRVTALPDLNGALLATGFPFRAKHRMPEYQAIFSQLFEFCADMRRAGAAALDLAYVASGRLDAYWEMGLKPWDTAAGDLLVREAGGIVTDFAGGHNYLESGNVVAGAPKVMKQLLAEIRPHLTDTLKR
ncbi:inositol-1-monophosphatase [Idiomarina xiamenensis]|uniref:Inositol-1-monophosphatase n=1 Tax=Idiomarina xiamenensis 10-D-4 TaxID=740709 RepID=K2KEV5_9GAMM|nr:inositol-1-monophosphatase [Idiomarina xiamenensis]EKE85242.1 inositol monophosphatase [Idiomarina xiamenensis 10-D-4]